MCVSIWQLHFGLSAKGYVYELYKLNEDYNNRIVLPSSVHCRLSVLDQVPFWWCKIPRFPFLSFFFPTAINLSYSDFRAMFRFNDEDNDRHYVRWCCINVQFNDNYVMISSMAGGCEQKARLWRRRDFVTDHCNVFCGAVCEVWRVYSVPDHRNTHRACGRCHTHAVKLGECLQFRLQKLFSYFFYMKELPQHVCSDCTEASTVSDYYVSNVSFCCHVWPGCCLIHKGIQEKFKNNFYKNFFFLATEQWHGW